MFEQYFGNYIVEKNIISQAQLDDIMSGKQALTVKLGLIAVSEKLLTATQAEELNELQKQMDKRFGDIAVEKGYLLKEEVNYLLNLQGSPYVKFVQALTDSGLMTIGEVEKVLESFKKDNGFSDTDLEAIKSGDIDRIIPIFVDVDMPFGGECISLAIRNIIRFISNKIMLMKSYKTKTYSFSNLACQQLIGDNQVFVGFASKDKELLTIAGPYAGEAFTDMDEDAFDSVCEFINCSNGLYASKLSHEDINLDMTPPLYYTDKTIVSKEDMLIVPVVISGKQSDLLVATNHKVQIN